MASQVGDCQAIYPKKLFQAVQPMESFIVIDLGPDCHPWPHSRLLELPRKVIHRREPRSESAQKLTEPKPLGQPITDTHILP